MEVLILEMGIIIAWEKIGFLEVLLTYSTALRIIFWSGPISQSEKHLYVFPFMDDARWVLLHKTGTATGILCSSTQTNQLMQEAFVDQYV